MNHGSSTMHVAQTQLLAEFAGSLKFEDLPDSVVADAVRLIIDSIGVAIGGHQVAAGRLATEAAAEAYAGSGTSTVLGAGRASSAAEAAFVNAYLGNVLDADDTFINTSHPAVCALFPALALAEREGLSGRQLITAFVAAYEVSVRVGLSLVRSRVGTDGKLERSASLGMGWYAFGAAVSAAKALDLSTEQIVHTLGVAAASSPIGFAQRWQSTETDKPMMKYSANGFIAANGVIAASLARRGFTADTHIFDGIFPYWELSGAMGSRLPELTGDLGSHWWISETTIKPYALGGTAIYGAELVKSLVKEHSLTTHEIDQIHVESMEGATRPWFTGAEPGSQIDMAFSFPLGVAAAALGIEMGPTWQERCVADPELLGLARRVRVSVHPDAAASMAAQMQHDGLIRTIPHRVTIHARGREFSAESEYSKGNPWSTDTRLTDDEVDEKFRVFTYGVLGEQRADEACRALRALASNDDLSVDLGRLLRPVG